jgi:hypothetical protein
MEKEVKEERPSKPSPKQPSRVRPDDGLHRQLAFAPLAWLKLRLLLHGGDTEVGGFGISSKHDLLYIEDVAVPVQRTTPMTVEFEDASVADHFDNCLDRGIGPARCGRIWIHTHPGSSPAPSFVDEQTFARAFGNCDWAVMAIVARSGASYARLRFGAGPGGSSVIPITVDWERFSQDLLDNEGRMQELITGWLDEYGDRVHPVSFCDRSGIFEAGEMELAETQQSSDLSNFAQPYERLDPLDELYDQMMLSERFSDEFDRQEVWQ